ncbi:CPBP family intramembrane glutamic endopeptidase [Clostridium arbusti]|uniref:CPBP family intramembrane glutamic endopeptidase n=1 Tax=Clostridium arbusti TaxID=1137848 RepID=UPI00030765F7|nr:CPBP family intramembrane glutamic endopeptidase [Clostridium arbusti]
MQISQLPTNTLYIMFSLIITYFAVRFIIKRINFNYKEMKLVNIKHSAIISLIVVSSIIIIMCPLILIFIKIFIVNQMKVDEDSGTGLIIYIIIAILEIMPVMVLAALRKERLSSLGITKNNIFKSIFIGLISYLLFFLCIVIIKHKFKYVVIPQFSFSIWSLMNCFFTALGEEIIFRGYVQYRLTEWLGDKKGLISLALIFSFSHIFQRILLGNMNAINIFVSLIGILPGALFMGYLFLKCKNIASTTIFHTFYDFFNNYI